MLYRAEILTPWVAAADDPSPMPSNHPKLADDYTFSKWEDVTGQPSANIMPDPNLYIILVEAEQAIIEAIDADPDYEVLWSEEEPNAAI